MPIKLLKKLAIACLIASVLTACTTNINGDFCLIYEPVYPDYLNDTPKTINQIDRNNVVYDELSSQQSKVPTLTKISSSFLSRTSDFAS